MKLRKVLCALLLALFSLQTLNFAALADEGMWTFNNVPRADIKKKYGFDVTDEWLKKVQGESKDYREMANVAQTARAYGDVVVVTGIYVEKLKIKGKNVDRRVRFTDAWIFENGHWECVASQSTLIGS